nr:MAG TPA: hypothetical protein [Caudoviricetes sp.]
MRTKRKKLFDFVGSLCFKLCDCRILNGYISDKVL